MDLKQNILLPVDELNEPDYEYMEQYIKNPMGKNNAVMSAALRETIKKQYDIKFHNQHLRPLTCIRYFKSYCIYTINSP